MEEFRQSITNNLNGLINIKAPIYRVATGEFQIADSLVTRNGYSKISVEQIAYNPEVAARHNQIIGILCGQHQRMLAEPDAKTRLAMQSEINRMAEDYFNLLIRQTTPGEENGAAREPNVRRRLSTTPPPVPKSAPGGSEVSGHIFDSVSDRPLAGVAIFSTNTRENLQTISDQHGWFQLAIAQVPASNEIRLKFIKTGYQDGEEIYYNLPEIDIQKSLTPIAEKK